MKRFFSFVLLLLSVNGYLMGQDGSLDLSFNPGAGTNGFVYSIAIQQDGKILIAGEFSSYNGIARNNIARVNVDGTLDTSFNPGTGANLTIYTTTLQQDGKIIIGGQFTNYNGTSINHIARINWDGSLDVNFNPGTGSNNWIWATALQPDGKIILVGDFTNYSGVTRNRIARINVDGSLDISFNPGMGATNGTVYTITLQPNDKILIAGDFTNYDGVIRNRIARVNADGSLDISFNPGMGANSYVHTATLQQDGKIILGGDFSSYFGTAINRIVRINTDGTIDGAFNPGLGANGRLWKAFLQPDGKIIIGGAFTSYNGVSRSKIGRLNTDGSLDMSFNPGTGTNNNIYTIAVQQDGKIIIGGQFISYNGDTRNNIARIHAKTNHINGSFFNDLNSNCTQVSPEFNLLATQILSIQPGNIIAQAQNGYWSIDSLPPGTYTATVDTSGQWKATCSPSVSFTVVHPDSFVQVTPIGMTNINPCTEPEISIYAPTLRRCFSNQNIYVQACNNIQATGVLYNAFAIVTLDSFLTVTSATMPYTALGNNVYRFQLDSLYPSQCKTWTISTTVSCSTTLGQTLCMNAELFPVAPCVLDSTPGFIGSCTSPVFDQSHLKVKGDCTIDSVIFTITNLGTGDMQCFRPVRIYIDGVLTYLDSVLLNSGSFKRWAFEADGRTWRCETEQHPLHPGNPHPSTNVSACGDSTEVANFYQARFMNSQPHDDADPVIDIYCGVVSGSFDPNDKTGYPTGVTNNHYILKNQQLQYVIRFQNTGTDTAFTVVIRDTLDTDLDIFSVKTGVSSHNYSFRMYGPRVLEWTFNNIMLPDSFHSEPNSHGFVTFTVEQVENLPNGTLIENSAAIYFDFNDPIITNTAFHTVTETWPLVTTISKLSNTQTTQIQLFPNPTEDKISVVSSLPTSIKLLDLTGRILQTLPNLKTSHELNLSEYPAGIYLIEANVNGKVEVRKVIRR